MHPKLTFLRGPHRSLILRLVMLGFALAQAAPAGAATYINERVPESGVLVNPCTGEPIVYEGFVHIVGTAGVSESGQAHFTGHLNFSFRGITASGAEYRFVTVSNDHEVFDVEDFEPQNFTSTGITNIIRLGEDPPEDDVKGHFIFHLTINANGQVTAVQAEPRFDCT